MSAHLEQIRRAGFVVEIEDGALVVEPYSKLTGQQLSFLKSYKTAIIGELMKEAMDGGGNPEPGYTMPLMVTCRDCDHFKPVHKHGGGAGKCAQGITFGAPCLWSESQHQCEHHAQRSNQQQDLSK